MVCHVVVRTAMWRLFIGPRIDPKNPKMNDKWHPLVLPRHHDDASITCHLLRVPCTFYDVDVIRTDVDSSPTN
jgi:hypothetical protein